MPTNDRPSHGMRRSWKWSDSQTVQTIGKTATTAMAARAGSVSAHPSRASFLMDVGTQADLVEECLHGSRRVLQGRTRLLLVCQRAMQRDLQHLREFRVDGRD